VPLREAEKTNTGNVLNIQNDLASTERLRFAEETILRRRHRITRFKQVLRWRRFLPRATMS